MFGNKTKKIDRLLRIGRILQQAGDGLTQAELARKANVNRSTINKDLAVLQEKTGILVWEDEDGRLHWFQK